MVRAAAALLLIATTAVAGPTDVDLREEHAARRAAFARELGEGTAVLLAISRRGYGDYRPEPNLFWLTGVESAAAALVLRVDHPEATDRARKARVVADRLFAVITELRHLARAISRTKETEARDRLRAELKRATAARADAVALYEDERGPARVTVRLYLPPPNPRGRRWTGPSLTAGPEAVRATGIEDVRSIRKLYVELPTFLTRDSRLLMLPRSLLPEPARAWQRALPAFRPDLVHRSPARALARARATKSPVEIARIRRACELTARGLTECMERARPGMKEHELQARLEFVCRRGGARRQAFASIVGSGPNGTILHYDRNDREMKDGDLVLMDVGAEYMGYAADVTRTFPVNGRFSARQAAIYDVVLAAQRAAIAVVKPGVTFREVGAAARAVITEAGFGKAFLHGVGHYVGLDVHDPSPGGPFRPGTVITVEPGIYLADEGIGIRIEDTVLVTAAGADVLSKDVVKGREEIEKVMER